jgi:hypothetical protein
LKNYVTKVFTDQNEDKQYRFWRKLHLRGYHPVDEFGGKREKTSESASFAVA